MGPAHVLAGCRVTRTIETDAEFGFTYATLPGHPEEGEERCVPRREADGRITFEEEATSRHADVVMKVGGPVSDGLRRAITRRYLRLDGLG